MTNPSVCAVCLTRDRLEMFRRTLASFRAQNYNEKHFLIFNTGDPIPLEKEMSLLDYQIIEPPGPTIGELRNRANAVANCDILIHFDDDDYSHPNRIAEQVALLQARGADAVGYSEMLFWRTSKLAKVQSNAENPQNVCGEAWLYRNPDPRYATGTSLCYWRDTWKRKPFPALPRKRGGQGEDHAWIQGLNVTAVNSLKQCGPARVVGQEADVRIVNVPCAPRLIASIHSGNSMPYDIEDLIVRGATEWTRVPEWDDHCRKVMAL